MNDLSEDGMLKGAPSNSPGVPLASIGEKPQVSDPSQLNEVTDAEP